MKREVMKRLERELEALMRAYDDWLEDKGDLADADLISAVGEFCRMVQVRSSRQRAPEAPRP